MTLLALCVSAQSIAGAQGTAADSAHARAVRVVRDSLLAETCRGGTLSLKTLRCTGATATTRVTAVRRLALRLDSLEAVNLTRVAVAAYDSTASVAILLDSTSIVEGGEILLCGIYTTVRGRRGLLEIRPASITNGSPYARLEGYDTDTGGTRCAQLAERRGVPLTPGMERRPATWTVRTR